MTLKLFCFNFQIYYPELYREAPAPFVQYVPVVVQVSTL
jgi:hypothetical protein